jgi:hypothetical protein
MMHIEDYYHVHQKQKNQARNSFPLKKLCFAQQQQLDFLLRRTNKKKHYVTSLYLIYKGAGAFHFH